VPWSAQHLRSCASVTELSLRLMQRQPRNRARPPRMRKKINMPAIMTGKLMGFAAVDVQDMPLEEAADVGV
jgi:hypothetical protein